MQRNETCKLYTKIIENINRGNKKKYLTENVQQCKKTNKSLYNFID